MPQLLSTLPSIDPDTSDTIAVIDTPKGSPNKYKYDEEWGVFRLNTVMPKGSFFPYDFGFVPSTLGEDGDPLDVLVFMDDPAPVGCVLTVRLMGRSRPSNGNRTASGNAMIDCWRSQANHPRTRTSIARMIYGHDCSMRSRSFCQLHAPKG